MVYYLLTSILFSGSSASSEENCAGKEGETVKFFNNMNQRRKLGNQNIVTPSIFMFLMLMWYKTVNNIMRTY